MGKANSKVVGSNGRVHMAGSLVKLGTLVTSNKGLKISSR